MRLLITGAAGFLGSHLVERLLAAGHQVTGVDNFLTGSPEHLAAFADHPAFTLVRHDITRGLAVDGPLDGVLHLASAASPVDYLAHAIETLLVGSQGTLYALELARTKGACFLLASTSEVYGDPQVHPQPESYWGHVNPIGPRSVYDESKRFAEALVMAFHRTHGLDTRIIRIFNTYGPRMRENDGRVVSNFITQALRGEAMTVYGDGTQTRSFCYVADLVEGLVQVFESREVEPVNLGNPQEVTMETLARTVLRLTGSSSPVVHRPLPQDDPRVRRPDITRARRVLGWEPRVPLEAGLARTIAYFRERMASRGQPAAGRLDAGHR